MFKKKTDANPQIELLKDAINDCAKELKNLTADDPSYAKTQKQMKDHLLLLWQLEPPKKQISSETWLMFAATVGVPLLIFAYEQTGNIVNTKSLSFWKKP